MLTTLQWAVYVSWEVCEQFGIIYVCMVHAAVTVTFDIIYEMQALFFEYMDKCPECVTISIVLDMLNPFVILYAITLCYNEGGLTQNRCRTCFFALYG